MVGREVDAVKRSIFFKIGEIIVCLHAEGNNPVEREKLKVDSF